MRFFVFPMILVVLLIPPLGCSKAKEPFNIGFNEWVGFAPFFLAKEKEFYGDLEVNLHFIALKGDKRAGLYAGRFQMIAETMDMFQTNRDNPDYLGKIVFAIDDSLGADGVIAIKEIQSLKDIKGRVVVSEPGLPAHFILQYLLHEEGMTIKDLKLRNMTSADAAAAFIAGKADVAGTYEPYLTKAIKKRDGAHLLVSRKDLPGLIVDVAVVSDETLSRRKKDVEKIYRGWCEAVEYFEKKPEEAISIMGKAFKLKPEEFYDTISGLLYFNHSRNQEFFGSKETGPIFELFETIGEILKENNLTKATASSNQKIDLSIVNTRMK